MDGILGIHDLLEYGATLQGGAVRDARDRLAGQVALVTGGAVGIGRAIVEALASEGAQVGVAWHSHVADGETLVRDLATRGTEAVGRRIDARVPSDAAAWIAAVLARFGRIDMLVNNAGGLVARQRVDEMSDEHWRAVLDVNLTSAFYCTRAVLPHLSEGGRIVNVSSLAGLVGGGDGSVAYAAAKAGLLGMTRGLAKELAPRRITVNAVAPGFIGDTPFHDTFTPVAARAAIGAELPLGREGRPGDVAGAVLWLCSDGASWVTGEVLNINGGQQFL